ncbi:MAG TPA: hypothetical protein VM165_05360 [Planctomycetaceae bacterium]|nr:hypothetical protein [Planctomycetaceae bacterium]
MTAASYDTNVFLNCPFDEAYEPLLEATLFTVFFCGFRPRCALEIHDSGSPRIEKIADMICECRLAIHDISRTDLDPLNHLPRFNMPFELGLFLGAQRYGTGSHKRKRCLILDIERYRYQKFLSDIAGQDPSDYQPLQPDSLIRRIRDWLKTHDTRHLPGAVVIQARFAKFQTDKSAICDGLQLSAQHLTYVDLVEVIRQWITMPEPIA